MNNKILILGSKGMLGQELVRVFGEDEKYQVIGWDREEADVTDFEKVSVQIRNFNPDIMVNAIAYNAVDQCEDPVEYGKAELLNVEVPRFLASLAKDLGATFVHYSSDYVFDGENAEGYIETAETRPISKYGESKLGGEQAVCAVGEKYYIIRLSKLFGRPAASMAGKKSFFEKMIEIAETKTELTVVDDEVSRFTYAPDLAHATKSLLEDGATYEIYHLTNEGNASWYEAANELFRVLGKEVAIRPIKGDELKRPAKRPRFSELLNTKRPLLRSYTDALEEFLKN